MSSSPTDIRPVFDTVVASAARYCGAYDATMLLLDGGSLRLAAHHGPIPIPVGRVVPVVPGTTSGRAVLERRAVHVTDIQAEPEAFPESCAFAKELGYRAQLSVPLLRERTPIGTLVLRRTEVTPFTDKQIAMLQTFANQAVIAIENVRLSIALQEKNQMLTASLAQQTATSDILRLTSESLADAQPTFEAIAVNAAQLCDAVNGFVFRYDGELIYIAAYHNVGGDELDAIRRVFPIPPGRGSVTARAILTRAITHVPDLSTDPEYAYTAIAHAGFRTVLAVPMLRDGREGIPLGAIVVTRMSVAPFSPDQIELVQTFARQAVIAVEAVRLFRDLQARTRELGRSVEELRALGEVSRAVSSTLDLDTVLNTIVARAVDLSSAQGGSFTNTTKELGAIPSPKSGLLTMSTPSWPSC